MTTNSPSPLKIDDLKTMPIVEVLKLVKDLESICKQSIADLKVYFDNMQTIHKFIKDNISV